MSANVPANTIAPVPEDGQRDLPVWVLMIARALNYVLRRTGATTITLNASSTSTTLTDDRIGPSSAIMLMPMTANATTLTPYISARATGSATIHHGSFAASDLTFSVLIG